MAKKFELTEEIKKSAPMGNETELEDDLVFRSIAKDNVPDFLQEDDEIPDDECISLEESQRLLHEMIDKIYDEK